MKDRINKKVNNKSAFTLAETLVAILILLMVSMIVATGMPAARRAYEGIVKVSNAELLMSTTISALRNELGTARNIKTNGTNGNAVTYYNKSTGLTSKIYIDSDKNEIEYQMHAKAESDSEIQLSKDDPTVTPLISSQTVTKDLYIVYTSVVYNDEKGFITFNGLVVKDKATDNNVTNSRNVSIKTYSD